MRAVAVRQVKNRINANGNDPKCSGLIHDFTGKRGWREGIFQDGSQEGYKIGFQILNEKRVTSRSV